MCRKGDVWLASSIRIEADSAPPGDRLAFSDTPDAATITPSPEPISLVAPSAPIVGFIIPPAPPASLNRET